MDYISTDSWTTVSSCGATHAAAQPLHHHHHHPGHEMDATVVNSPVHSPRSSRIAPKNSSEGPRYSGLEVESVSSSSSDRSWMKRIRWFRNTRRIRGSKDAPTAETHYVGGTMESAPPKSFKTTAIAQNSEQEQPQNALSRIASWMTANSSQRDEESVIDFKESEWTPEDSSYGAACPLFGWIPKNRRRSIEYAIIFVLVIALVYLMVMLSIVITKSHREENMEENSGLNLDDDRYISYDDDSHGDDDPYWTSSNNGGGGGYGGR
eukprot:scaffold2804_cov181-Amphora_coffeaeformis.AAC.33